MSYPRMMFPEPLASKLRVRLREISTWKLKETYSVLGAGQVTGLEILEVDRAHALSAIREMLWERGQDANTQQQEKK